MLRNNKGSVLVFTLMLFSIIMTVCVSCLAMARSNNDYSKLQYEHIKYEELALSGIEITRSNLYTSVKYAIENFDEEDSFEKYFLGNTRYIIGNISNSGLYNVRVSLKGKVSTDAEGNITFRIESVCKDGKYIERIAANVKIINPWSEYIDYTENNEKIKGDIDTTEEHKNDFDQKELVVIYNYEEI